MEQKYTTILKSQPSLFQKIIIWIVNNKPTWVEWWIKHKQKTRDKRLIEFIKVTQKEIKDSIIIIANPKDDSVMASYRGSVVNTQLSTKEGKYKHLIKDLMKFSTTDKSMNNFLLLLDGILFNLAKDQRDKRNKLGKYNPFLKAINSDKSAELVKK